MTDKDNNRIERREFLGSVTTLGAAGAASLISSTAAAQNKGDAPPANPSAQTGQADSQVNENGYRFKIGMYLPELDLPFDESLATAKQIGIERVWFNRLKDEPEIAAMSDAEIDRMAERVAKQGLEIFLINCGNPFKTIHLTEFSVESMSEHPAFRKDFDDLVRSMQVASRIGVPAVGAFSFAWPGEYSAGKPTWPMRWLTRGGVIADVDMEKLVKAFTMVAEEAERYKVDVALSMMPWNYTNTTGNFRRVVEGVGSKRLKVMWGPADNLNSGEWDAATAGFQNVRPHLYGLHLKDLHVSDGLNLKFEYRPLGEGDVDYLTVLRNLRNHRSGAVLSLATHFRPASGSRIEAMQTNYANLKRLIEQVEAGAK